MFDIPAALAVLAVVAAGMRNWGALAVAGALFTNWLLCAIFSHVAGDVTNWVALAAIDYTTAVIIAVASARRWALTVVGLYALMLLAHVTFSMHETVGLAVSRRSYFDILTVLAWLQLAVTGGWIAVDYRKGVHKRRGTDRSVSVAGFRRGPHGGETP